MKISVGESPPGLGIFNDVVFCGLDVLATANKMSGQNVNSLDRSVRVKVLRLF